MKAVVLFSGGIDSTTVIYHLLKKTDKEVYPLHFIYGQKSSINEEHAVWQIVNDLKPFYSDRLKPIKTIDLSQLNLFRSALTDEATPVPTYDSELSEAERGDITFVPFRNVIFISMAVAYADAVDATKIYTGTFNSSFNDDCIVHYDASPEMSEALAHVVDLGSNHKIKLISPFYKLYKREIFKMAESLGVPLHHTWTCYAGGEDMPCGVCISCESRRKALKESGINDTTRYAMDLKS